MVGIPATSERTYEKGEKMNLEQLYDLLAPMFTTAGANAPMTFSDFKRQANDLVTGVKNKAVEEKETELNKTIESLKGENRRLSIEPIDNEYLANFKSDKLDNTEFVKMLLKATELSDNADERRTQLSAFDKKYESQLKALRVAQQKPSSTQAIKDAEKLVRQNVQNQNPSETPSESSILDSIQIVGEL